MEMMLLWLLCSELFEPAIAHGRDGLSGTANGPILPVGPDYAGQQRKDSWRGRSSSKHISQM